ncbi:MAG: arginine deiminase family protein [Psychroflexus sp.]|jgi:N-dimethylarginine dimethylaminohydrolase|nr:arginine deiminase family protein [Psychroflexus sp.]MDR9448568.1 arginine deiminase family protein [Psychroflexus sp.]
MRLDLNNETSILHSVILGTAQFNGETPSVEEAYDPKSIAHIKAGTYPDENDMIAELASFKQLLEKYDVNVYQPNLIKDCNQIFARDIGFVIEDKFVVSNILPHREKEVEALGPVLDQIDEHNIIRMPEDHHIEGGDVMLAGDYIFIGTYRGDDYSDFITARTNQKAIEKIAEKFPSKKVKSFNLRKSNSNPYENALHLDCCFQPVGKDAAIIHRNGFLEENEYQWLVSFYGKANIFEITKQEMYDMTSNIFSIAPDIVISDYHFERLNTWLESRDICVEKVNYREIAKQEGLLRCSTLPLIRD